jgi:hypothetical protein
MSSPRWSHGFRSTRRHGLDARRGRGAPAACPRSRRRMAGLLRGRQRHRLLDVVASRPAPTAPSSARSPVGVRGQQFNGPGRPSCPPTRPPHYPTSGYLSGGRAPLDSMAPCLGRLLDDVVPRHAEEGEEGEVAVRATILALELARKSGTEVQTAGHHGPPSCRLKNVSPLRIARRHDRRLLAAGGPIV